MPMLEQIADLPLQAGVAGPFASPPACRTSTGKRRLLRGELLPHLADGAEHRLVQFRQDVKLDTPDAPRPKIVDNRPLDTGANRRW